MSPRRSLLGFLLIVAAIFYLVFIFRTAFEVKGETFFTLVDDAMVSMRYARDLAQGDGLVWNVGQPPVEGFTNLGWTLMMTLVHLLRFPINIISLVIMLLGMVILLLNIAVVYRIASLLDPGAGFAPLIAAAITAFYFPLIFWTLRGLEVGALALMIGTAVLLSLRTGAKDPPRRAVWLAVSLAAALILRMDALIPVALILLFIASGSPRSAILPALSSLAVFLAILAFQRSYFGDFLPNTYYLKVSGVSTWERIRTGWLSLADYSSRDFLMPLVFVLIGFLVFKGLRSRASLLLLSLFLAQTAYSIWVGGDYAEELVDSANRFVAQGMPALIILFSLVLDRMLLGASDLHRKPAIALLIVLGAVSVMSAETWVKWGINNAPMLRTDIQRVRLGLHVKEYTDPAAVIAVHAAGQIPYYSERVVIDLLGKSDPVIARGQPAAAFAPGHNKWDYEYSILQLRPDVIADNFNKLRGFMADHPDYILLPNGIYVRADSTLVEFPGIAGDYH